MTRFPWESRCLRFFAIRDYLSLAILVGLILIPCSSDASVLSRLPQLEQANFSNLSASGRLLSRQWHQQDSATKHLLQGLEPRILSQSSTIAQNSSDNVNAPNISNDDAINIPDIPDTDNTTSEADPIVLVAEVVVVGVSEGELQDVVYKTIRTQPGRTTTRTQLQEDIDAIFAAGYFANVRAEPEDTPLGVRVTFVVQPNPVFQGVQIQGNQVLPQTVVDEIFLPRYGRILNLREFQTGIEQLNEWYQANGYVLAQLIGPPQMSPNGTVTLEVAEGIIEDIEVVFLDSDGLDTDEDYS
jgi:outer membrane protein assembly factor BamA